ncbi:hypothetical protein FOQG_16679 [Fusarium oxysporum f. sp. raphani 54005]|uniref:Uncharacterized protein n=3 Tax=Fusarium oxysporum TaxID=5507 RepID=X0BAA4_FUSOX|nr:hypothetical protein FOMG_15997 [Fusarium oxysporum f. sp. melonis 26406]EXK78675.1 hypothetical protein FOQG_16679 [Fusarium oxysporum f. sp. raphani 54005]EXK27445.1 hypothetical protein FOMG_15997 [Fusarium oxysporum f. sp. melonis 26406]EXK27446.1 hypothetical protein FOMG_15997 [Fusarium oxysporum f. sp. melonis 26406]EXK78676.1 hypothetical protein FOQG_16679 [Fusarium oxysporum f. sp. raphani 54005]
MQTASSPSDETTNGEFVSIDKRIFKPSKQDRLMSWQAGSGRINIGGTFRSAATGQENIMLPKETYLAVEGTIFKLEYK